MRSFSLDEKDKIQEIAKTSGNVRECYLRARKYAYSISRIGFSRDTFILMSIYYFMKNQKKQKNYKEVEI